LGVVTGGLVQLKLPENSPVGSIVSELRGSIDSSTPINAELEFRIVKSDRQNGLEIFEIEGNQGKLIVKQSPDREILCPGEEKCLLEVQVVVLPQAYYQDLSITIELEDTNDNAPVFVSDIINIEINENTRSAYSLDNQMAYDPDIGENGKIIYTLDDESIFTLEQYEDQSGSHLDLIPVGVIDREKFKSAELKMTASNPKITDQMDQSTTVTIHVTVLDENEFKPTFTRQVYEFEVSESVAPGTAVGRVVVNDGDGSESVTLQIRDVTARQYFRVQSNGQIFTNRKIDYEQKKSFQFWIIAADSVHSERAKVSILVLDENDNEPDVFVAFTKPHLSIPNSGWVEENGSIGMHIGYVRAEDKDSAGIKSIELMETDSFELDKGIIKTKRALDRETKDQYILHIVACDNSVKQKCTKRRLIIFVRDLNDNSPICENTNTVIQVSESEENGAFITQMKVSDLDSETEPTGYGSLNYRLEPAGQFKIDSKTGVVTLAEELDYESQATWTLEVVARDGGDLETRCHLEIQVQDANEAPPIFQTPTEDDLELLINSKELKGSYLMSVEALDPDYNPATAPKGTPKIMYSLSDSHDVLKIESISGEVTLNKAAEDIPEEYKTFRIIITATDSGTPPMSSNIRLTVALREGVVSGLVQNRRALKGGATLALIAILAALTALLLIILIALAFICRHKKSVRYATSYSHGNTVESTKSTNDQNSRCDEIDNFIKIHDDVSILYDSILTPRSSIGPNNLYKADGGPQFKSRMILDKIFKRKYVDNNMGQSEEEKSDRDSGKGESDHDTINPAGGPKCDENCLRLGHSDSCWIEEDNLSQSSSKNGYKKCNIIHSHNPSLHQSNQINRIDIEHKKEIHSSGYISQDTDDLVQGFKPIRMGQSTPIKSRDHRESSDDGKSSASSLVVSNKTPTKGPFNSHGTGCIIDVSRSDISGSDLTVRDLSLRKNYQHSPKKINIV